MMMCKLENEGKCLPTIFLLVGKEKQAISTCFWYGQVILMINLPLHCLSVIAWKMRACNFFPSEKNNTLLQNDYHNGVAFSFEKIAFVRDKRTRRNENGRMRKGRSCEIKNI